MGSAERVVFTLRTLGEAGQATALAQRADAVAAAGQDLVRIALVADVPAQPIARRVEHIVQRNRQLDHAKPGAKMAARLRDGVNEILSQLVGDLAKPVRLESPQVIRSVDLIEKRSFGRFVQKMPSVLAI